MRDLRSWMAVCIGAAPLVLLSCVLAVTGSYAPRPVPISYDAPSAFALQARATILRAHLPDHFVVRVQAPFVLAGDVTEQQMDEAAEQVRHVVDGLREVFFERDPDHIVDLYLFADRQSYRSNARAFLEEWPPTPHGYYAPKRHAVVVNYDSGARTLMHELVHPLLDANFPGCPAWFNEGFAALFEHSAKRDGRLVGLNDDRLPRLQRLVQKGGFRSLAALTVSTDREFYNDPRLTTYAHARYLLMYLQERQLLQPFYTQLRDNLSADPTGLRTLQHVTAAPSGSALQRDWESFVLSLPTDSSVSRSPRIRTPHN